MASNSNRKGYGRLTTAQRLSLFDQLPKELRSFLANCEFNWNSQRVWELWRDRGTNWTLSRLQSETETRKLKDRETVWGIKLGAKDLGF